MFRPAGDPEAWREACDPANVPSMSRDRVRSVDVIARADEVSTDVPAPAPAVVTLRRRVRSLVRAYPAEWRMANGQALIGAVLDELQSSGLSRVPGGYALQLVVGGIRRRISGWSRGWSLSIAAISVGSVLWALYAVVSWAPRFTAFGATGPFSNPSVIAGGVWFCGVLYLGFRRQAGARVLFTASGVIETMIGVCATLLKLPLAGPGVATWVCLSVLAFIAAGWSVAHRPSRFRPAHAGAVARMLAFVLAVIAALEITMVMAPAKSPSAHHELLLGTFIIATVVVVVDVGSARRNRVRPGSNNGSRTTIKG